MQSDCFVFFKHCQWLWNTGQLQYWQLQLKLVPSNNELSCFELIFYEQLFKRGHTGKNLTGSTLVCVETRELLFLSLYPITEVVPFPSNEMLVA